MWENDKKNLWAWKKYEKKLEKKKRNVVVFLFFLNEQIDLLCSFLMTNGVGCVQDGEEGRDRLRCWLLFLFLSRVLVATAL